MTRKLTKRSHPKLGRKLSKCIWIFSSIEADDEDADEIIVNYWYEANHILGYFIEEEIFFDKRRSKLDFRYVSITPVVQHPAEGIRRDLQPFISQVRELLANHKVFPMDGNLAQRMSFDEFFTESILLQTLSKKQMFTIVS